MEAVAALMSVRRAEHDGARVDTVEALLSVLAAHVRARKPERARWEAGRRDCRWTPPEVFDAIERARGKIDLDPAGDAASPVRAGRSTLRTASLSRGSAVLYCNPPTRARPLSSVARTRRGRRRSVGRLLCC